MYSFQPKKDHVKGNRRECPMSKILEAALEWLDRGVAPVPIIPGTKKPSIKWRRYQDELPDSRLVRLWFQKDSGLALICGGKTNLTILDFDRLSMFYDWKAKNIRRGGIAQAVAQTGYKVRTPRGMHVYVFLKNPIRTQLQVNGKVDIKAEGGYVLAPPTIHPSGSPYVPYSLGPIIRIPSLSSVLTAAYQATPKFLGGSSNELLKEIERSSGLRSTIYYGIIQDLKTVLPVLTFVQRYTIMGQSSGCGRWWMGRCPHPNHEDRNPSFRVDSYRNKAHCLTPSCRLHEPRGLDIIDLYARLHNTSQKIAMMQLGIEVGLIR
jgi:hypothetical protein